MTAGSPPRYCARCGTRLAGDNRGTACGPCERHQAGSHLGSGPPQVPAGFWQADLIRDSLAGRHMGHFLRAYREHPFHGRRGIPQEIMARWLHLSQTQLSRIENGPAIHDLRRLTEWAKLFRIPPVLLWFDIGGQEAVSPAGSEGILGPGLPGQDIRDIADEEDSVIAVTPLQAARRAKGWSQGRAVWEITNLAAKKNMTVASARSLKTQLSRWENGHVTPEYYRPLLRELLGLTRNELTPAPATPGIATPDNDQALAAGHLGPARPADTTGNADQPDSRYRPTLLRALITERHWQRFGTFEAQFRRAARELAGRESDPDVAKLTVSSRQWERWYSGNVKTEPHPDACRVLEHLFGYPIQKLLAPDSRAGIRRDAETSVQHPAANIVNDGFTSDDEPRELSSTPRMPDIPASNGLSCMQVVDTLDSGPDLRDSEDLVGVLDRIQRLHRGIVHPEVIRQLDDSARSTVAQYEKLDHSTIVPALLRQRSLVNDLLGECCPAKQQRQLYEIAATMSGVLGYIAVGRGDFPLARAYTLEAFQLGDFAEKTDLQAWARGLQSFCEYYSGRYDDALSLAEDGLNYAQSGPQSVRLAVNGVARARGKLGDVEGVDRAVGEAYDLMSRNDVPDGMPSSISFECYSAAQTASNAATAYVSIGKVGKVRRYVDLAMPEISNSDSQWSRSLVMIDLALSHARAENPKEADLDRATELMLTALSISADRPVVSVLQRASEFIRDATDRWGNVPQVRKVLSAAEI